MAKVTDENDDPITDFTGYKNKDLPPELVRRRKKAKREGYVDKDLDGENDIDTFNTEDVDIGWAKDLINSVPELAEIFDTAAREGWLTPDAGAVGQKNLENRIQASTWFQTNGETAREMLALEQTDAGEFAYQLDTAKLQVQAQARDKGIQLSEQNANNLARQSLLGGWGERGRDQLLTDALMALPRATSDGSDPAKATGSLGEYMRDLRNVAAMNGLTYSDDYYYQTANSALAGSTSIEDSISDIREEAAGLWPPYADKIRAGQNARDLASSYIQNMASVLQIDPQSISLDDPYIQGSITAFDDQGNPRPKSLWEQSNELRKDPRWIESNDGQNKIASAVSGVTAMFGITN